MKLLLVDLDDTLIDTASLKEYLFTSLNDCTNLEIKYIQKVYESLKNEGELEQGWVDKFVAQLSQKSKVTTTEIKQAVYKSVRVIKIKRDMLNAVKKLPNSKYIITAGDKAFQKAKIQFSKINKYFNGVIYAPHRKDRYLISCISDNKLKIGWKIFDEVEIIDDKDFLLDGLSKYPWIEIKHPKDLI